MSTELQVLQSSDGFSLDQQKLLEDKLQERNIKERPGAGSKKLKYVSGDYAIATANRIFGFGKWGYRVLSKSRESVGDREFYTADIELYVIGCPFPFPGEGVGVPQNATIEQHEKARKEAVTDALKRALRHFGDQFGLSLYNEDNWIEADDGTDKRVKDVGKQQGNGYKPAPPKIVDARPTIDAPFPSALRERHKFLGMHDDFETIKVKLFKRNLADDELSPEQCITINGVLERFYEKQAAVGG